MVGPSCERIAKEERCFSLYHHQLCCFQAKVVLNGGLAKMASTYASELVNTVLRGLRQQMLDDGWISELELQFFRSITERTGLRPQR